MSAASLRVLMISGDLPVDGRMRGGVAAAVSYLADGLRLQRGVEVVEISAEEAWPHRTGEWWRPYLTSGNGPSVPTVVHAHGAAEAAWLAALAPVPSVVTVHGIIGREVRHEHGLRNRWRTWRGERLARAALRRTRRLIAISEHVLDHYRPYLAPNCHVERIPNAVDPQFFAIPPVTTSQAEALRAPTILFAGRLIPRKRPLDLLRAFAALRRDVPTARLRLCGPADGFSSDDPAYRRQLIDEACRLGIDGAVTLTGLLDEGAIVAEYEEADLVCLPSAQETAPMSLAQALAAGRPIVATDVGGVKQLVGPDAGVLVQPGDVDGLARALAMVLLDRDKAAAMSVAGRARAAAHQPETVALRTLDVYRSMLGEWRA